MLFGPGILLPKESAITPTMKQDLAFAYQLFPDKGRLLLPILPTHPLVIVGFASCLRSLQLALLTLL